jgi:hypothetical protein
MKSADLRKLLDSSGFPFQKRVEAEVREKSTEWEILTTEHPWTDPRTGNPSFIDIILHVGAYRLIIECKRVQDGEWIFLVDPGEMAAIRCGWIQHEPNKTDIRGWWDAFSQPASSQGDTCIIRSQEEKAPLLERIASTLVVACDTVAGEFVSCGNHGLATPFVLIPMIVTNARLYVTTLTSEDISLETGKSLNDPEFEEVEMVRFRKPLTTSITQFDRPDSIEKMNENRERTVLVVNSGSLMNVLSKLRPEKDHNADFRYPWDIRRQVLRAANKPGY